MMPKVGRATVRSSVVVAMLALSACGSGGSQSRSLPEVEGPDESGSIIEVWPGSELAQAVADVPLGTSSLTIAGDMVLPVAGTLWRTPLVTDRDDSKVEALARALGLDEPASSDDEGGGWIVSASDSSTLRVGQYGGNEWNYSGPAEAQSAMTTLPCSTIPDGSCDDTQVESADTSAVDRLARDVLAAIGVNEADVVIELSGFGPMAEASARFAPGGVDTTVSWFFSADATGTLLWASGPLGVPDRVADVPLIGNEEALQRLSAYAAGGYVPVMTTTTSLPDGSANVGEPGAAPFPTTTLFDELSAGSAAAPQPTTSPDLAPAAPSIPPPTTTTSIPNADRSDDQLPIEFPEDTIPPREPATVPAEPGPPPVPAGPTSIELATVELSLLSVYDVHERLWLVPAFTFSDPATGFVVSVPALTADHISVVDPSVAVPTTAAFPSPMPTTILLPPPSTIPVPTATTTTDSAAQPPASPPAETAVVGDDQIFVLPDTDDLALLDSQAAASARPSDGGPIIATFALAGSPDNDADGRRVWFGIADATGIPTNDVTSVGTEIAVGDRSFHWVREGDNQRTYVGPSPEGVTLSMSTLNIDEAVAVRLLAAAETSGNGGVVFDGQVVPDGWVDTGTSTTLLQFIAGATGSSTPISGTRDLYGDPASAATPLWGDINTGFGVTLSTWPVSGTDPESEARYNLDGEVDIEIQRADGSITPGFASPADSEFLEFVVWQDGVSWLALSRPVSDWSHALADLATTVREANANEVENLTSLRTE